MMKLLALILIAIVITAITSGWRPALAQPFSTLFQSRNATDAGWNDILITAPTGTSTTVFGIDGSGKVPKAISAGVMGLALLGAPDAASARAAISATNTSIQATRTVSGTSGTGTWVFSSPFAATPTIQITAFGAPSETINNNITAISPTQVTYSVTRTSSTVVALIGLTILSVQAPSATTVHITAVSP